MRHVRFEVANRLVKSLRCRRRFRRKELERKRGRILPYDVRDVHAICAYLRSFRDLRSTQPSTFLTTCGRARAPSGFRRLIEVCQQLNLVVVRAQNVSFERIVVLGRGKPWIGIRGLVPGCCDFPILVKKFQHRQAPAGIVGRAFCIFVLCFCRAAEISFGFVN